MCDDREWPNDIGRSPSRINVLILAGALVVAAIASLTRINLYTLFYAGQAAGIAIIFAGSQGLLDDLPVEQVQPFEEFLYPHLERKHSKLLPDIANKKELTDELRDALTAAVNEAKTEFIAARGIKAA